MSNITHDEDNNNPTNQPSGALFASYFISITAVSIALTSHINFISSYNIQTSPTTYLH